MDGRDYMEVLESLTRQKREEMTHSPLGEGDDSSPLFTAVSEPAPSHWGSLTSTARTISQAYLRFLGRS